jgi:hypothetical protein
VGNPPFGRGARLAVSFFNHAAKFAQVIAFIVPRTFRKASITNSLDLHFEKVDELLLPVESFLFENASYNVPCVFQIWKRSDEKRLKIPTVNKTKDFCFVKPDKVNYDLVFRRVGVNAGRLFENSKSDGTTFSADSHQFILLSDKSKRELIVENIKSLNLEEAQEKYDVAGNPCLNASEICNLYNAKFK